MRLCPSPGALCLLLVSYRTHRRKQESVADLEGKVKELEGFCTEALDELDAEKAKNEKLMAAAGN